MNRMKDKLTSSVRKAKTKAVTLESESGIVIPARSASDESVEADLKSKSANSKQTSQSISGIPESNDKLFPERIWPD